MSQNETATPSGQSAKLSSAAAKPSSAPRALVAGATGAVGRALVDRLLASPTYVEVRVLVRRPFEGQHEKLVETIVDFDRLAAGELEPARLVGEEGDDDSGPRPDWHVFCALGTTLKRAGSKEAFRRVDFDYVLAVGRLAESIGARRFLFVSSMGAEADGMTFYLRVKGEVENALAELDLPHLYLVRPSLLLAERDDRRLGEEIAAKLSTLLRPLLAGPLLSWRPIEAEAVARAMVAIAAEEHGQQAVFEADDLHRLARAARGRPVRA